MGYSDLYRGYVRLCKGLCLGISKGYVGYCKDYVGYVGLGRVK